MGQEQSKPKNRIDDEELLTMLNRRPEVVLKYFQNNTDTVERYITDNFWEEDVERWLDAIRKRSPKENLQVRKVDFLKAKNCSLHYTSEYENSSLVIRRADHFQLDVYFGNRSFKNDRDDLNIIFKIGTKPSALSNTKITCAAAAQPGPKNQWNCTVMAIDEKQKKLSLRINVPADAIVGRYSVSFEIVGGVAAGRERSEFNASDVIVLFNPYSKEDTVYMEDKKLREEYVGSDTGFVVTGVARRMRTVPWTFAQFDEGVLDAVLLMLQNDSRAIAAPEKTMKRRKSPVFVSRMLAAMVNCNDDKGVLEGKWLGDMSDGKRPGVWRDSSTILFQWRDSGMKPVKYGQCWVFSAVLNTALRAVGIPARSVTNFESAHDKDGNQIVDMYYDLDKDKMLKEESDSIWNFHVWNEAYFKRPDLAEGYDGWQAVDATPQEVSDLDMDVQGISGLDQCGPAPVKAVKEGEINIGYDTGFVFSEVNADQIIWYVSKGEIKSKAVNRRSVGKGVATKAVGEDRIEMITDQYKYPEGSENERKAFRKAYGLGSKYENTETESTQDYLTPKFQIALEVNDDVEIGKDISVKVTVKNLSMEEQNVDFAVTGSSKRHTGRLHSLIKKFKTSLTFAPNSEKQMAYVIHQDEYLKAIVDNFVVALTARVTSSKDGSTCFEQSDVILKPPECLTVAKQSEAPLFWSDVGTFDVVLKNVTSIKLTKGEFDFEGRGIDTSEAEGLELSSPILPGDTYTVKNVKVRPKAGWRRVYGSVSFDCAEISGIKQSFSYRIKL